MLPFCSFPRQTHEVRSVYYIFGSPRTGGQLFRYCPSYRTELGTTRTHCAVLTISISGHSLLYKITSFIITKCVILSFTGPLTRVCQRALLKLTAGYFISCLADKESFWVHCFRGKNDVWLLLEDNAEQNCTGTRESG